MPKHPTDLLNIEAQFSTAELELRDRIAEFVDRRIRPDIGEWYENAVLPRDLLPQMAEQGLFGMHLSGCGCAGRSATEYGLAMQELETGDSGLRTVASVHHCGSGGDPSGRSVASGVARMAAVVAGRKRRRRSEGLQANRGC